MSYGAIYSRDKSRSVTYQKLLKYLEQYRQNEPINFNGTYSHRHTGHVRSSFPHGMPDETKRSFLLADHIFDKVRTFSVNITIILPHLQFVKVLMVKTIVGNPLLDHVQQRSNVKDLVVKRNFMSEEMYDDFMLEQCLSAKDTTIADKKDANFKSTLSHIFQNLASLTLTNDPEFTGKVLQDFRRARIGGDELDCTRFGVKRLFDFR